jgi:hypothetical protein
MSSKIIGRTHDLYDQIIVVVHGSGVYVERTNRNLCPDFNLHPDCARKLAALLSQAADVADMAVPGPIRNGRHETKTSLASEGQLQ